MTLHPRRVPDWVRDIREAIEYIHLDMGDLDRQAFEADGKTVRAVTKSIVDIGEAPNQVMPDHAINAAFSNRESGHLAASETGVRHAQCAHAWIFPHGRQCCLGHRSPPFARVGQAAVADCVRRRQFEGLSYPLWVY